MNKFVKIILIILGLLLLLWMGMFTTDYIRCGSIRAPIFVVAKNIEKDGGSGLYQGLGYSVNIEKHMDSEGQISVNSVEMIMFGKTISASIT